MAILLETSGAVPDTNTRPESAGMIVEASRPALGGPYPAIELPPPYRPGQPSGSYR
jgi:hypothetical protein